MPAQLMSEGVAIHEDDETLLAALHLYCDGWNLEVIAGVSGLSVAFLAGFIQDCEEDAAEEGVSLREFSGFPVSIH